MENERTRVLWISGAPGSGKSTTGWGLFTHIAGVGGSVAHVDIDQLGLVGPPPGGGSASHRIKADNLLRMLGPLRQRGVRQVIVSGVVDPLRGIAPHLEDRAEADHVDFALVRLRCDREELRRRFLGRGSSAEMLTELFAVADQLDRDGPGTVLDTSGQRPEETVDALLQRCVVRPAPPGELPGEPRDGPPVPAVVVTGAAAVGKSTAAWRALRKLWARDVPTGYVDLGQLGFVHPGPDPALEAAHLAALRRGYHRAGARALLVVVREPAPEHLAALLDAPVTVVHLDADAPTLADRVRRRAAGEAPLLAGDELRGAPTAVQRRVAARAAAEADRMRRRAADRIVLDTTGRTADETADALLLAAHPLLDRLTKTPADTSGSE
ncbi:AAA family ATPase [Saccharopolyspora cebuensis]|uniref:AAA family ATPase n=1 Tax=Saccharopolyspora cebuensis TaxID=418759 RepID=A0ABV4CKU8_9PSEU